MLFSRIFGRRRSAPSAARPGFVPELTALEVRDVPAVYTVTNTSADLNARGSLPWAVHQANYTTPRQLDYIRFNIPGAGRHVITINDTLYLNDQVVIEGDTQPGYAGEPLVSVQGTTNVPSLFLLQADPSQNHASSGSTIQGLEMTFYTSNAVTIFNSSQGNWIQNNWIGFSRPSPTQVVRTTDRIPNAFQRGVGVASSFNVIRFNTISGVDNAVVIADPAGVFAGTVYKTNSISGNRIGTDPTGTTSAGYGNASDGVFLGAAAQENFIGPDNTISGNASAGVELFDPTTRGNVVFRNFIGTNAAGTAAVPNGELGVLIANGATSNAVGGPFGGNVISGNRLGGIALGTPEHPVGVTGNWIQFNIIGLTADQSAAIPGQQTGIAIAVGSDRNVIQSNAVAGNTGNGVLMSNVQSNFFQGNWVGMSSFGVFIGNGGFGVVLLSNANFNYVWDTAYGANALGNLFVHDGRGGVPPAVGNSIR